MNLAVALKEALVAAFVAGALFVPIVGMVLGGRSVQFEPQRVAVLVLLVLLGRFAVNLWRQRRPRPAEAAPRRLASALRRAFAALEAHGRVFVPALLVALVVVPFLPGASNYLIQIMTLTLIYVVLAMGLNIVVGLAGLLDLGFVAFYAVGAYGYALLALHLGLSFWWAIPLTAALAAAAGCVLGFPVLRMHGDYLAIVTLGFGEIIRILLVNMVGFTGGPNGINAPRPTLFGLEFTREATQGGVPFHAFLGLPYDASYRYVFTYLVALGFAVLAIFVFRRLREMPIGRAWEALREDEIACKALGIDHTTTKLSAFTLGAAFGGVGGVLFAAMEGFINPSSFTFIESAIILAIVVLGGMGSIVGVAVAAVAITLLPELFREFQQFRMLFFGMAMVGIMVWRPGGLLKARRRTFVSGAPPAPSAPSAPGTPTAAGGGG
jgi:branched-chain amino acid transport system permease protein